VRSVNGFFAKDAVIGELLKQPLNDDFVREFVRLRDGFAIIGTNLLLNVERSFIKVENRRARFRASRSAMDIS